MVPRKGGKGPTEGGPEVPIQGPFKLDGQKASIKRVGREVMKGCFGIGNSTPGVLVGPGHGSQRTTILNLGGGGEVELVERPLWAEASEMRQNLLGWPGLGMKASGTT
jgi:hypothetical protein